MNNKQTDIKNTAVRKRVIFHIGHAKTATTSIQHTLKENRSILDEHGYSYPLLDGTSQHNKLLITLFKNNLESSKNLVLAHDINLKKINFFKKKLDLWLRKKLASEKENVFIISAEAFPNFTEDELESIKEYFQDGLGEVNFEIYAYTRDPLSFASSSYQQRSKTKADVRKQLCFSYENKISKFINIFGKSHINIYKLEDGYDHPNGPVGFLLNKMGLNKEIIDQMDIHRSNESMTDLSVDLCAYINREIPLTQENTKAGLRIRGDVQHLIRLPGHKFRLPLRFEKAIREESEKNMIWLSKNFDINYSEAYQCSKDAELTFDSDYVDKMIVTLKKVNPIIRKLIYTYIKEKIAELKPNNISSHNLTKLESHIVRKYPLAVKLSFTQLSYSKKLINYFLIELRVTDSLRWLRWLRYRWKERTYFNYGDSSR